jgi:hypothetical protein
MVWGPGTNLQQAATMIFLGIPGLGGVIIFFELVITPRQRNIQFLKTAFILKWVAAK